MKLKIKNHPTKRNPKRLEVVELKLEPELAALIEAFAAEADMSPESFGSMVVDQYQAHQN
jgi:hypothetical protein